MFKPGKFDGLNLYIDLDVVITANIDDMIAPNHHPGAVTAPDDFSYSLVTPKQGIGEFTRRQLGGDGTVNSSVMIWSGDDGSDIYNNFSASKMDELHGRFFPDHPEA